MYTRMKKIKRRNNIKKYTEGSVTSMRIYCSAQKISILVIFGCCYSINNQDALLMSFPQSAITCD